ncbi:MAG: toxic anion resistance protein [Lachnospiraceae bacterium]|nr:toxic anion resistance protein [Lachnospiraceae bacterium]
MEEQLKEFTDVPTPTLSFGAPVEEKPEPVAVKEEPAQTQLDESMLSEDERRMVDEFSKQIDIHNTNGILQYGVGTQKKMADFSETALKNVKTKDLGEVGDMISGLVTELKSFDVEEEEKGFLGFFKKSGNKMTALKAKYDKAEVNVEKICDVLEGHQRQLMKDVAVLDKMYEINLSYFKELSMYILAGKKRLAEVRATELAEATAKAKASDLPEDAQAAKDLEEMCNRFEKKIHDLELTRMIAIQTAPQIRLVQSSNTVMIEKIQSTVVNTIPLWKSQMVIALGVEHANQAARAQREVTDMTNELLRKNAAALKTATVEAAKESERGIVDLDTLKTTNQALISTFDEVMKIQEDGRVKRHEAEGELARMELELKNKLLEIRG